MNRNAPRTALALTLALAAVTATAGRVALAGTVVSGIGSRDCAAYMRAVEINSREAIDAYVAWGQGYLSGYDDAQPGALQVAVDGEALGYWLIDYCQGRPERSVFQALQDFLARQRP